jgi:uracil-DNA glycosylase
MKRTIFIGQAMPRVKRDPHDWPSLNAWLFSMGFTRELLEVNTLYSALVNYFPGAVNGSHLVPTRQEIEKERPRLAETIKGFSPELVVPVGALSISYCLRQKVQPLVSLIGKKYFTDPYGLYGREVSVVPLPHPSGASTWRHKKENKVLLVNSLQVLKKEIFGR